MSAVYPLDSGYNPGLTEPAEYQHAETIRNKKRSLEDVDDGIRNRNCLGEKVMPWLTELAEIMYAGTISGEHALGNIDSGKLSVQADRQVMLTGALGQLGREFSPVNLFSPPMLEAPTQSFNASDMIDLLQILQSVSMNELLKTANEGVDSASNKTQNALKKQQDKIQEWIKKSMEAASKGLLAKVFNWGAKALALVATFAAVLSAWAASAATGGASTPLLVMAVVGLISTIMSLANDISVATGGPEFNIAKTIQSVVAGLLIDVIKDGSSVGNYLKLIAGAPILPILLVVDPSLLGGVVGEVAVGLGANESVASIIGLCVTVASALCMMAVMIRFSAGTSMAAAANSERTSRTIAKFNHVSEVLQNSVQFASGGFRAAEGYMNIAKAQREAEAQHAISEKKELEALRIKWQRLMEEGMEDMKKIVENLEESMRVFTKMLAVMTDSNAQIAKNLGGRATV